MTGIGGAQWRDLRTAAVAIQKKSIRPQGPNGADAKAQIGPSKEER